MKCVEMNGVVVRVKNEDAVKMVKNGGKYVAKKFLKDTPKPVTKKEEVVSDEIEIKVSNPKKYVKKAK